MSTDKIKISAVIPAHNEEGNVESMVKMLFVNFGPKLLEVVVVNDCSTDKTGEILNGLRKRYPKIRQVVRKKNGGVGHAIRAGLAMVSKDATHVLMLDCDFTKNADDIRRVVNAGLSSSLDGVLGSRYMEGGKLKNYPPGKKIGNRTFHILCKALLDLEQADVTNNFRFYRREIIEHIKPYLTSSGFSINAEVGLYPIVMGFKIIEVPVSWIQRTKGMGLSDFKVFRVAPGYIKVFLRAIKYKYFGFPVKQV